jgi:hypothetical protein
VQTSWPNLLTANNGIIFVYFLYYSTVARRRCFYTGYFFYLSLLVKCGRRRRLPACVMISLFLCELPLTAALAQSSYLPYFLLVLTGWQVSSQWGVFSYHTRGKILKCRAKVLANIIYCILLYFCVSLKIALYFLCVVRQKDNVILCNLGQGTHYQCT